jgi:hypothetical protein
LPYFKIFGCLRVLFSFRLLALRIFLSRFALNVAPQQSLDHPNAFD